MKKRTFYPEMQKKYIWEMIDGKQTHVEGRGYWITTHNELRVGKFIKTKRKAYCRGCTKIIGGDVLKLSKRVIKSYGKKGELMPTFSYCLKCAKILMMSEIKECNKHIRDLKKNYSKVTRADKIHSSKRIKEDYIKEKIVERLEDNERYGIGRI